MTSRGASRKHSTSESRGSDSEAATSRRHSEAFGCSDRSPIQHWPTVRFCATAIGSARSLLLASWARRCHAGPNRNCTSPPVPGSLRRGCAGSSGTRATDAALSKFADFRSLTLAKFSLSSQRSSGSKTSSPLETTLCSSPELPSLVGRTSLLMSSRGSALRSVGGASVALGRRRPWSESERRHGARR